MENVTSKFWYMILLRGIVLILLSVLIFMDPEKSWIAFTLYIGIGALASGFFILIKGFSEKRGEPGWGWSVFTGMIDLFLGYVLISHPSLTFETLPFIIGFWGAFYGISLIVSAFSSRGSMLLKLISGILLFALANLIMFNPLFAGMTLAIWIAVLLMIAGLYSIFISYIIKEK